MDLKKGSEESVRDVPFPPRGDQAQVGGGGPFRRDAGGASTMQYHYEARYAELIALLLLAAGLLATTLFWAGTEPAYMPIASGLGFFAVLRFAVDRYTHRLRLEPDALTTVSYFRRERLPYRDIRAIRYWISDRDSGRITVTLVTKDRDFDIRDSYANFTEIVDTIRQHCPQAKIQDERKFG